MTLFRSSEEEERRKSIAEAGLKLIKDEVLKDRIESIYEMLEAPNRDLSLLDRLLDVVGAPWGRSADDPKYYKAYISARKLVAWYRFMAKDLPPPYKKELFENFVEPWLRMLIQGSFKDKDVSPNTSIVIHTQPPIVTKELPFGVGPSAEEKRRR